MEKWCTEVATKHNLQHVPKSFFVSAQSGHGVKHAFEVLAEDAIAIARRREQEFQLSQVVVREPSMVSRQESETAGSFFGDTNNSEHFKSPFSAGNELAVSNRQPPQSKSKSKCC